MDLYSAMQPILDSVVEQRMAQREAPSSVPGMDGIPEPSEPIKLAIIGQPNVVRQGASPTSPISVLARNVKTLISWLGGSALGRVMSHELA